MFIDSHAHLEWESYEPDFEEMLNRAKEAQVEKILNIGTTLEHCKKGLAISEKHLHIFQAIGIHPHEVKNLPKNYIDQLKSFAKSSKVVAVGEIGLDYFYEHSDRDTQLKCFEEQIQLAKDLALPLSIHCREAFEDAFSVLDKFKNIKGVFHCFTGTWEDAQKALDRNFYISISGIVTFRKAHMLQEVVKKLPLEKMLIETDAPFLAPEPYRGKRNEPAFVVHTAKKISELKNISIETVAKETTKNAKDLFKLGI